MMGNIRHIFLALISIIIFSTTTLARRQKALNPPNPEVKSIVLPYERAKAIRGCTDCKSDRTSVGENVCLSTSCHPLGTRCSHLPQFGRKFVTASSHHCKIPSGGSGVSLFCCEKGSKEALNILTLRARPNQYPHHVYLGVKAMDVDTKKTHYLHCGGTIIDRWWILSATHCTNGPPSTPGGKPLKAIVMVAVVGQNHVQIAEPGNRYEIDLENSVDHPGFSYSPFVNDISLLKLKKPLSFNGFVSSLKVANSSFIEEGMVEIIGYGKTDVKRSLSVLLTDTATIMDNDKCARLTSIPKPRTLMCVGGGNEAIPNQGDSGGPAICRDRNNNPVLCGITSNISENVICDSGSKKRLNIREGEALPEGCGYPPAVYTRVSRYYDWIMKNMKS